MDLVVLAGSAHPALAEAVAARVGVELGEVQLACFPDGELHVEVGEAVVGRDVFVVQPTAAPVGDNLLELLLLADAARRMRARRVIGVVPYLGYARADRRGSAREPLGARLVAGMLGRGGLERCVLVDLHTAAVEGAFDVPVEHLTAEDLLAEALRPLVGPDPVFVAPDLKALRLAERQARRHEAPVAAVHKVRTSGTEVRAGQVIGDVRGRRPVIVDDLISTAGTLCAAVRALIDAGCVPEVTVVATHALWAGPARERLESLPLRHVVVTDSVAQAAVPGMPVTVASLAPLLAEAVVRLHLDRPMGHLVAHG